MALPASQKHWAQERSKVSSLPSDMQEIVRELCNKKFPDDAPKDIEVMDQWMEMAQTYNSYAQAAQQNVINQYRVSPYQDMAQHTYRNLASLTGGIDF